MGKPQDPNARSEYRRLIAWGPRIEREGPWLLALLGAAPERSVLDLGCGTGEHVAFLADAGARAVGVDPSDAMLEAARDHEQQGRGRFFKADARDLGALLEREPAFGFALCLGNMLAHLLLDADLGAFAREAHRALRPGGTLLLQVLNYVALLEQGVRHLPLNVRPADEGREIVFLRLLKDTGDGGILFFPTTLELDTDAEEPVRVLQTRRVPLRAWTWRDLSPALTAAGFTVALHGDMQGGPFDPASSYDLVIRATRPDTAIPR